MSTTIALIIASTVFAGGSTPTLCPFTRVSNPPLSSLPIFGGSNEMHRSLMIINAHAGDKQDTSTEYLVGSFTDVYSTFDAGATFTKWSGLVDGMNYWGAHVTATGTFLAVEPNHGVLRSTDNGNTFTPVPVPMALPMDTVTSTAYNQFVEANGQIIWGTQNGLYFSENDGNSWAPVDCKGLIGIAVTPNNTAASSGCGYLFVRGLTYASLDNKVLVAFGALGLSGIYSLQLPLISQQVPQWGEVIRSQVCDMPPQTDGSTLCNDHGPMMVMENRLYVATGPHVLEVPYPFGASLTKYVFTAPGNQGTQGIAATANNVIAVMDNTIYVSNRGGTFRAANTAACFPPSPVDLWPTNPGTFSRGIIQIPSTNPAYEMFLVGSLWGPYIFSTQL